MSVSKSLQKRLRAIEVRYGIRNHVLRALPFWVGAAITACVAVGYAKLFAWAESWAIKLHEDHEYWMFLTAPLCFVLSYALVQYISPKAGGSGIPQLMAASELAVDEKVPLNGFLGFRIILTKVSSSLMACLGGGAIGREGPTLQIAGSVFYLIRRILPRSWSKPSLQTMILAGGGAGLAAAFNTPLGGIVYVVEELSKVHISSFRTSLLQSVIIAGLVAQGFMGPYLYLGYPVLGQIDFRTTLAAIVIGICIGAAGALFSVCLKQVVIWRSRIRSPRGFMLQAAGSGIVMAAIVLASSGSSIGSGKEVINSLLFHGPSVTHSEIAGRYLGPIVTYAAGGAGGIFAPALSAGAAVASIFNGVLDVSPVLLALLGMVAFLTAVTQTPFTSFVLVLEMTDRHAALFPMMVAAMVAHMTSKLFVRHSFYDFVKDRMLKDFEPGQAAVTTPPSAS